MSKHYCEDAAACPAVDELSNFGERAKKSSKRMKKHFGKVKGMIEDKVDYQSKTERAEDPCKGSRGLSTASLYGESPQLWISLGKDPGALARVLCPFLQLAPHFCFDFNNHRPCLRVNDLGGVEVLKTDSQII